MNAQEQIEAAWKAGFECAMAHAWSDSEGRSVWSLDEDEFKEALNKYINKEALV
jgi:hypothetical protein